MVIKMSELETLGVIGLLIVVLIIVLIPFIVTVIVGVAFANMLGFTGITWWAFVILFYLIIGAFFAAWNR